MGKFACTVRSCRVYSAEQRNTILPSHVQVLIIVLYCWLKPLFYNDTELTREIWEGFSHLYRVNSRWELWPCPFGTTNLSKLQYGTLPFFCHLCLKHWNVCLPSFQISPPLKSHADINSQFCMGSVAFSFCLQAHSSSLFWQQVIPQTTIIHKFLNKKQPSRWQV